MPIGSILFPPPDFRRAPEGEPVFFPDIVSRAGLPLPISSSHWPEVRLVAEPSFLAWTGTGAYAHCVDIRDIDAPRDSPCFWRSVLRKLAFQFQLWMAKEAIRHARRRGLISAEDLLRVRTTQPRGEP